MTIFVCDVSSFQADFNFGLAVQQGASGFIVKATQGSNYVNPYFGAQLARAQATGKPTSAYHYLEIGNAATQVGNIQAHVPAGIPVITDTENGGDLPTTRAVVSGLRAAGRSVPLAYLPAWWLGQQSGGLGQSTADIAPLWDSWYPDNAGGSLAAMYARAGGDSSVGWNGYGGNVVKLFQFGSTVSIGGYSAIDTSAFKGTEDELRALFEGDDMALTNDDVGLWMRYNVLRPGGDPNKPSDYVNVGQALIAAFDGKSEMDAVKAQVAALQTPATPVIDLDALAVKVAANITLTGTVQATGKPTT